MSGNDAYCFACGKENPIGLKLEFEEQDGKCITRKTLSREYEGYEGIAHGGILSTMLDEVMVQHLRLAGGEQAVTAKLDLRYRKPTPVGEELTVSGWEDSRKGQFVRMKAKITLPDGTVTVEASAQMALTAED